MWIYSYLFFGVTVQRYYFVAQLLHLAVGISFSSAPVLFQYAPCIWVLPFWCHKMLQAHLYFFLCGNPEINPFSMETCFCILEIDNLEIKIWALSILCCCGSVIVPRCLCMHTSKFIFIYIWKTLSSYWYFLKNHEFILILQFHSDATDFIPAFLLFL